MKSIKQLQTRITELEAKLEAATKALERLKAEIFECEHSEVFNGHTGDWLYPECKRKGSEG